jgi:hypothetical protein
MAISSNPYQDFFTGESQSSSDPTALFGSPSSSGPTAGTQSAPALTNPSGTSPASSTPTPVDPLAAGQVVGSPGAPVMATTAQQQGDSAAAAAAQQQAASLARATTMAALSPSTNTSTGSFTPPPTGQDLTTTITNGFQAAYGRAPSASETAYWQQKWPELVARGQELGDPNYAWNHLIGQGATGADAATAGPYKGGGSTSGGGTGGPATGFADPAYQQLLSLAQQRITQLGQPQSFPQLDSYMAMLQQNETAAKARAQTFADQLSGRVSQLQQPLLSQGQVAQQQALASNNLLAQRDAALQNQQQQRYASGFAPTSGLIAGDQRSINQNYTNAQAQINAQLQQGNIATDEQRRNEATTLQGLAQQALQGGDTTALQSQAQVADLENQLYNIGNQQATQQLATAQIPVDLTNQGFANANTAASAANASNPLQAILQLLQLGNQQQTTQQAGQTSNANGLAWLLQQMGL